MTSKQSKDSEIFNGEASYNKDQAKGGKIENPSHPVIFEVFEWWRNKNRAGNHATLNKRKMEVSGRKPWKQKGTGRARAGGFDSPIWVGGAVAHGPQPKSYAYDIPKKKLVLARRIILGNLLARLGSGVEVDNKTADQINQRETDIVVAQFEKLPELQKPSTKTFITWLNSVTGGKHSLLVKQRRNRYPRTVVVLSNSEVSENFVLSVRNVPNVVVVYVESLSAVNLIDVGCAVFSKRAIEYAQEKFLGENIVVGA